MTAVNFPSFEAEIFEVNKRTFTYKKGDRAGSDGAFWIVKMARPEDRFGYELSTFDEDEAMKIIRLMQENKKVKVTFGVNNRGQLEAVFA